MTRGSALALGALVGVTLALLLGVRFQTPWGLAAPAGLALGALIAVLGTRRLRRRARLRAAPLPESQRKTLEEWVAFYRELDAAERRRFEGEVAVFLDEQTITGPRGAPLDEVLRVLVAASAVVVAFGKRGFTYPQLRDVVVYEEAFDEDYDVGHGKPVLGMVHAQGPILFSAKSLRRGFRGEHDAHNVGYHEFAHVLDFDGGVADGVPGFMPWGAIAPWVRVMHEEIAEVEAHRSLLRDYAATNEAEFFAVATEVFFERPRRLREEHPELYALLAEAYGQDPAAQHPE